MGNDPHHERITIDVTTYQDRFLVRACVDSDRSSPLFDLTSSRAPHDALVGSLEAMSKVLASTIRGIIVGIRREPAPPGNLLDYIPLGLAGLPGLVQKPARAKRGR